MKKQIITKNNIKPSQNNLQVLGVFNAGATLFNGQTLLLLRVAEVPNFEVENKAIVPFMTEKGIDFKYFNKNDENYDFSDKRVITSKKNGSNETYTTSISHFRIAKSNDGINFEVSEKPTILPTGIYEEYGIEDPRITLIDSVYYITYSCASRFGIIVGLITTKDFVIFERKGYIFHPDNKDVVLIPKKINGLYYALHRPSCSFFGDLSIWISSSNDLLRFGDHKHLLSPFIATNRFDNYRIGCGAQPIETDEGYLMIYHGANVNNQYKLGVFLLDKNNPEKILKISKKPLVEPTLDFEKYGFVKDIVFSCGAILKNDDLFIYYGASDDSVGVASFSLKNIIQNLEEYKYEE